MSTTAALVPVTSGRIAFPAFTRFLTHGSIVLADLVGLAIAGSLAVFTRYFFHAQFEPSDYIRFTPAILIFFGIFAVSGLYSGIATSPVEEFRLILRASSTSFLLLIGSTFFLRNGIISSRLVIVLGWILTVVVVPASRRVTRGWCSRKQWWGIPTVIIGECAAGQMMLELLEGHRRVGLRPVALLVEQDADFHVTQPSMRVFRGDLTHARGFADEYRNCYAVVAMPTSGSARIRAVLNEYGSHYRRVLIIPDLFGMRSLSITTKDVCGVLALELDEKLTLFAPRLVKRCFDLIASISFALLASPVLLLLCLVVRLSSPGPLLYGQRRIGKNGEIFKVWKFRSMVVDADQVLKAHLDSDPELREEWNRNHKLKRDPRVTWIGCFMRKSSLDELPQIWNVICGQMSLVGPRPITHSEINRYGTIFGQYLRVIPGVTGLWQTSGRNNTTYELRTRLDDYYVRNWSLTLDLYILLRTFKTILLSEGAY
jgi:Undecaprenyl-phosphate galactose phosphotransferase WbaP